MVGRTDGRTVGLIELDGAPVAVCWGFLHVEEDGERSSDGRRMDGRTVARRLRLRGDRRRPPVGSVGNRGAPTAGGHFGQIPLQSLD